MAASVMAEAAAIAAGAQAAMATEKAAGTHADDAAATEAAAIATQRAHGAAQRAFAAAQAATEETAAALAAADAAGAAATNRATRSAAVSAAADAHAAVQRTTAAVRAAARAESHLSAVAAPPQEPRPDPGRVRRSPAGTLDRLTGLIEGLDEAVRLEWDEYLSWPVAPVSLPGADAGPQVPAGLHGLVRDLTLARRIELAVAEGGGLFQATFNHAPVAMLQATFDGSHLTRFLRVNPAMCRLTGYSEAELLELDPRALAHPDDAENQAQVAARYGVGDSREEVLRWMHADGHSIWVRLHLGPVLDADGSPEYAVGQVEDITSTQRVQAALRHSEALFRTAFEDAPIATMIIRLSGARPGGLLRANRAACRLTGHTETELMATDVDELVGHATSLSAGHPSGAGDHHAVTRYRHADGHSFTTRLTARVVAQADGQADILIAQIEALT